MYGQSRYELREKLKKERVYDFQEIDSTKRYYIAQTTIGNDSVILVIDKESKQLNGKKIENLCTYKFNTYTIYNIISPSSGIYYQKVDHKDVWCETDNKGLHFTDGMGNEYMEDEIKKGK